jgi:uncharacterized membrane protein YkoI
MNRLSALFAALTLAALAAPAAGCTQGLDDYGGRQQDTARAAVQARQVVPLERIIEQIRRRTPGNLLGAGAPSDEGGRMIYRILWDSHGRQLEYVVDARSGAIISVSGE